jgi:hypothetical protein
MQVKDKYKGNQQSEGEQSLKHKHQSSHLKHPRNKHKPPSSKQLILPLWG